MASKTATTTNITLLISTVEDDISNTQHMTLPIVVQGTLNADDQQRLIDTVQREVQTILDERKVLYDGAIDLVDNEIIQVIDSRVEDDQETQKQKKQKKHGATRDEDEEEPARKKGRVTPTTPTFERQDTEVIPVETEVPVETKVETKAALPLERKDTEVIPADDDDVPLWRAPLPSHEAPQPSQKAQEAQEAQEAPQPKVIPVVQDMLMAKIRWSTLPKCRGVVGRGVRKGQPCQWRIVDETLHLCKVHLNQHNLNYEKHQKNKRGDEFKVRIRDLISKRIAFSRKFPPLSLERSTSSDVHC